MTYEIPSFWEATWVGVVGGVIFLVVALIILIISFRNIRVGLWGVAAGMAFLGLFSFGLSIQLYDQTVNQSMVTQTRNNLNTVYEADFTQEEVESLMNYEGRYESAPGRGALIADQFDLTSPHYHKNIAYGSVSKIIHEEPVRIQLTKLGDELVLYVSSDSQPAKRMNK